MSLTCGIIGLPNVGKSTLFNVLTQSNCPAENFPFCTIEPNHAIVSVGDDRLNVLARIAKPKQIVPATVEFVDIAGLVKGAASGEGLGNQFLNHIRQVDALVHVVRCFDDRQVTHVTGLVDPIGDIETIELELMLADLSSIEQYQRRLQTKARMTEGAVPAALLERAIAGLKNGVPVRQTLSTTAEQCAMQPLPLLTAKPMLYVANIGDSLELDCRERLEAYTAKVACGWMTMSVKLEAELAGMSEEDRHHFESEFPDTGRTLSRLTALAYRLLKQQSFFTVGEKELRAWTIPCGATAPQAAGVIHSDFEKGFIRAEVVDYDAFVRYSGFSGAKAAGKLRLEGKHYPVQDGDILHFRFNV